MPWIALRKLGTLPSGPFSATSASRSSSSLRNSGTWRAICSGSKPFSVSKFRWTPSASPAVASIHLVVHVDVDGELLALHHVVEVVLVDVEELALLDRPIVGASGEVAHHDELERQLDLFLGVARGGLEPDVDPLLGSDRTVVSHYLSPLLTRLTWPSR